MRIFTSTEAAGGEATLREGAVAVSTRGIRTEKSFVLPDWVPEEVPLELEYNGASYAVVPVTPLDLEDFALGFSISEGILRDGGELYRVEQKAGCNGITLHLTICQEAFFRLLAVKESLSERAWSTRRGLPCAKSGALTLRPVSAMVPGICRLAVSRAMAQLRDIQMAERVSSAAHAVAWCTGRGEVRWIREDVGRQNALDKLIGALHFNGVDSASGFIAVTGHASYEMVQKAASAGVPLIVAVAAPTSFAIQTAQRLGVTLVGLARQHDLVVYCRPERLIWDDSNVDRHAH